MTDGQLVFLVAAVLVAAALAAWALRRQRLRAWHRFAARHGLRPTAAADAATELSGTVGGRSVLLRQEQRGSEADTLGVVVVSLSVQLAGEVPAALRVEPGTPLDPILMPEQADEPAELVRTGDDDFDARVRVLAADPAAAGAYLTPARRQAILRLLDEYPSAASGIRGRRLRVAMREVVAEADRLQECLDLLLSVAPALDGDRR